MTPDQSAVVQGYCAVLMVIATMAIPLFIWVSGKRLAAAQYVRDLQDLINQINLLALRTDENLMMMSQLNGLDQYAGSNTELRRVYLTFVCFNAFQAEFLGAKAGLVHAKYGYPALRQLVAPMLKDELTWRLIRERGYHPDFVEFCSQIRHGTRE
jgi:hypothetical protein